MAPLQLKGRYLCGLFGHRVEVVGRRAGLVEHACHCGHSFLRPEQHDGKIHHPLVCVLFGHYVSYVTSRSRYDEFICVNCGHPFCFATATRTSFGATRLLLQQTRQP